MKTYARWLNNCYLATKTCLLMRGEFESWAPIQTLVYTTRLFCNSQAVLIKYSSSTAVFFPTSYIFVWAGTAFWLEKISLRKDSISALPDHSQKCDWVYRCLRPLDHLAKGFWRPDSLNEKVLLSKWPFDTTPIGNKTWLLWDHKNATLQIYSSKSLWKTFAAIQFRFVPLEKKLLRHVSSFNNKSKNGKMDGSTFLVGFFFCCFVGTFRCQTLKTEFECRKG